MQEANAQAETPRRSSTVEAGPLIVGSGCSHARRVPMGVTNLASRADLVGSRATAPLVTVFRQGFELQCNNGSSGLDGSHQASW